jgi:hypothetical protein
MKAAKPRTSDLRSQRDASEHKWQEAFWSKSPRERALDALVVANRVIKQQIVWRNDPSNSEKIKNR